MKEAIEEVGRVVTHASSVPDDPRHDRRDVAADGALRTVVGMIEIFVAGSTGSN
jgi:hypothetical protein